MAFFDKAHITSEGVDVPNYDLLGGESRFSADNSDEDFLPSELHLLILNILWLEDCAPHTAIGPLGLESSYIGKVLMYRIAEASSVALKDDSRSTTSICTSSVPCLCMLPKVIRSSTLLWGWIDFTRSQ